MPTKAQILYQRMAPDMPALDVDLAERFAAFVAALDTPTPKRTIAKGPAMVAGWLLLGDVAQARDVDTLERRGVTRVLSLAGNVPHGTALHCPDRDDYDMREILPEALSYLRSCKDRNDVCLVHCLGGINRSGFVAIAALCALEGTDLVSAAGHVKSLRKTLLQRKEYRVQLFLWAVASGYVRS